jgi:hypothetical protein
MRSKISLGAVIVAILIVGATAPSATAAPPGDACSLLTPAQVSAVLGVSMGAGSYVTPQNLKTCTWTAPGGTKGVKYVTLSLQPADSYEAGKKLMAQAKTMMKVEKGQDADQLANASASGIGDDAYYTSMGSNYTGLMVKKGNVAFKVAIYGDLPIETKKAMEKTLALQVLSKV